MKLKIRYWKINMPTNTKNNKKQNLPATHKGLNKHGKALIFSSNEKFREIFTQVVSKRFGFSVSTLQGLDSLITEIYFSKYEVIYLDIDFIFCRLHEVLAHIRDKESKNKEAIIHLVTSNKENYLQLEKFSNPKNILLLLEGKKINYLLAGKQYIY